jgi:hypothetical protein
MAVRVPSNQIVTSKYTIGKEFIVESTYKNYQGYYYEFNDSYYAGEKFSTTAPKLIKVTSDKINPLRKNPNTSVYGNIAKVLISQIGKVKSIPFSFKEGTRYFVKKENDSIIKEVDKQTFEQFTLDPIYTTLSVDFTYSISKEKLTELDKKMPGIKDYIQNDIDNIATSSDEINPFTPLLLE